MSAKRKTGTDPIGAMVEQYQADKQIPDGPSVRFKFKPNRRVDGKKTPSNAERAMAAAVSLSAYKEGSGDLKTGFQDLLSDMMHLCDREGWDFDDILRMASGNWQAER